METSDHDYLLEREEELRITLGHMLDEFERRFLESIVDEAFRIVTRHISTSAEEETDG